MRLSNLPPGVTDAMIEENATGGEAPHTEDEHAAHQRMCKERHRGAFWPKELGDSDDTRECSCGQDFVVPGEHWHDNKGRCHTTQKCEKRP